MAVVGREKAKAGTNPTEERGRIGGSSLRRGSNLLFTRAHKLARPPPVAQRTRFGSSYIRLCSGDGGAQMLHASPAPPSHAPYMSTPPVCLIAPLVAMGRRDAIHRSTHVNSMMANCHRRWSHRWAGGSSARLVIHYCWISRTNCLPMMHHASESAWDSKI